MPKLYRKGYRMNARSTVVGTTRVQEGERTEGRKGMSILNGKVRQSRDEVQ